MPQPNLNPSSQLDARQVELAEGSNSIQCPNEDCRARIPLSNNRNRNPLYCPRCKVGLIITAPDGETPLNLHWAVLKTALSRAIGAMFRQIRFPDEGIARQWEHFEADYDAVTILDAARLCLSKVGAGYGRSCWDWIIRHVEKRAMPEQAATSVEQVFGPEMDLG